MENPHKLKKNRDQTRKTLKCSKILIYLTYKEFLEILNDQQIRKNISI